MSHPKKQPFPVGAAAAAIGLVACFVCCWVAAARAAPTQPAPPRFFPRVEESEPVGPLPDGSAPEGLAWACCDAWSGICVYVEWQSECPGLDYILACEWGMSNDDGSVTCYETE